MKNNILFLDTSAWICSFKKSSSVEIKEKVKKHIASNNVAVSQIVILELLQGCRSEKVKERLQNSLESLQIFPLKTNVWARSYQLGFDLRRKGLTIPTVDIIIAALTIENKCRLLHCDRHFSLISEHFNELDEEYLNE